MFVHLVCRLLRDTKQCSHTFRRGTLLESTTATASTAIQNLMLIIERQDVVTIAPDCVEKGVGQRVRRL